jgi:hypothetical protein
MEPTSDHEREISRLVDERARHGKLDYSVVREVSHSLSFPMSRADNQFLVAYLQWRTDHPLRD